MRQKSVRVWLVGVFALAMLTAMVGVSAAQESDVLEPDDAVAEQLNQGRVVYQSICVQCHQADGRGIRGAFPPLLGNPRIQDTEYVTSVITDGLETEIEVDGVTYDAAMPAVTELSEEEVAAVVAFVQADLIAPGVAPAETDDSGGTAGTELPFGAVITSTLAFLIALVLGAVVIGPIVLARRQGKKDFSPAQVWLKTGLIVVYFAVATVYIPSLVIESDFLASPPSVYEGLFSSKSWGIVRDLVGTGVWVGALGLGLWALRRGQRERVI